MQTFLPLPDLRLSVKVLDRERLNKQRSETKQIYFALTQPDYGWKHHPAIKMWQGYTDALLTYGQYCCEEWISRGYKDSLLPFFQDPAKYCNPDIIILPDWFGRPELHSSHRSNLVGKFPQYYRDYYGWTEPPYLSYWWPTEHGYGCVTEESVV